MVKAAPNTVPTPGVGPVGPGYNETVEYKNCGVNI